MAKPRRPHGDAALGEENGVPAKIFETRASHEVASSKEALAVVVAFRCWFAGRVLRSCSYKECLSVRVPRALGDGA